MQLTQIIRRASVRMWVLVLIPALVLASLAFLLTLTPSGHRLTATVAVTTPSGTDNAATLAVDAFRAALSTSTVRDAAAEEVGLDAVPERDVDSARVGVSNFVEIEVTTTDPDDLEPLALALIRGANRALYLPARNTAKAQRDAAEEELAAVQKEIRSTSRDGAAMPVHRYQAKTAEVTQLRVAVAGARARGEAGLGGLVSELDRATRELRSLGRQVRALDEQAVPLQRARTRLADSTSTLSTVDAALDAANDASSVQFGSVVEESRTTMLLRALVSGLVVAIVVAVGLVLLLGALRPDDRAGRADRGGSGDGVDRERPA